MPEESDPREAERGVDDVLGRGWLEQPGGIGVDSLFRNYLIRNFSHRPKEDQPTRDRIGDTSRIRYSVSNENLGNVSATVDETVTEVNAEYDLRIDIRLPASFVRPPE